MPPAGTLHRSDRARGDGLQKKVDDLVRRYRRRSNPSSVLLEILNDPEYYAVIVGALRRQASLSKCRSQEFEDCQVTIYDRALLILSNYGESATDPGALELYITEFLGVVPIAPVADGIKAVSRLVDLQHVLSKVTATHREREEGTAAAVPSQEFKREREGSSSPFNIDVEYSRHFPDSSAYDQDNPIPTATIGPIGQVCKPDVRVARLLDVYHQAKEDYFNTKAREGVDSLSAVRFLRDSAENTLRYLHANGMSDSFYVPDLEQTFAIARDKTAQLLGGRKRHFDEGPDTWAKGHRVENSRGKKHTESKGNKRVRRIIDSYRPQVGR